MNCRDAIRACSVVDDDCLAPANLQAAYTGCTCFACGLPVCRRCSRLVPWYSWPRRRVCNNCIDDRLSTVGDDDLQRLQIFAIRYDLRQDWHEPGEYYGDVEAVVRGRKFDNAGVDGEKIVTLKVGGHEVMRINLATLFALACRARSKP